MFLLLYFFSKYLNPFNLQEIHVWVFPAVYKSKLSFLFMHNWTTVYLRQRGSKPEVSEYVDMFHELRMWISCISLIQYFAHTLS